MTDDTDRTDRDMFREASSPDRDGRRGWDQGNGPRWSFADTEADGRDGDPDPELDFSAMDFWTDSESGSGSLTAEEDWVRGNSRPAANDGRSTTNTTFYADTYTYGPSQKTREQHERKSWSELATVNDDAYARDVSRGGQNFSADKQRWVETFGSRVGATSYQKERAGHIIERIDMGPYQGARIPAEVVILGILSLLIDAEVDSMEHRAIERESMQSLLDDLECARPDLKQARRLLHRNAYDLIFPNRQS